MQDHADMAGCLRPGRDGLLARVNPRAKADPGPVYHFDQEPGAFTLTANGRAGDPPTVVFIPSEVRGSLAIFGAAAPETQKDQDGSRLVTVMPFGGPFSIVVAPAPIVLAACG